MIITYETLEQSNINYVKILNELIGESILEVGCGEAHNLTFCKQIPIKKGIDAWKPIIDLYKNMNIKRGIETECYNLSNGLLNYTNENSFTYVLGFDIIEHFEKDEAEKLLADMEKVAFNKVILFVPVGNHPQEEDDRGLGNHYFQKHRSIWYPEDLDKLGYEVHFIKQYHNQIGKDSGAMFAWKKIN